MLNKKEVKDIQSLRYKKFRQDTGLFIAEGPKMVLELLQLTPGHIKKIYTTEEWLLKNKQHLSVDYEVIDERVLEKLSQLQTPNHVMAILRQFKSVRPESKGNLILYLDAVQDPGNFGTIIRIADWFAVKHLVCGEGCADLYNPKVVQSTMASIGRVNIYYDPDNQWLCQQEMPVYATTLSGTSIYTIEKIKEGIVLIGNESKGIRPELLQVATQQITIPRKGQAESLNAAVATGIILSHLAV